MLGYCVEAIGCCLFGWGVSEPLNGPVSPRRERDRVATQEATGSLLVQAPPALAPPMPQSTELVSPRLECRRGWGRPFADRPWSQGSDYDVPGVPERPFWDVLDVLP
jgi:hypothetical protein